MSCIIATSFIFQLYLNITWPHVYHPNLTWKRMWNMHESYAPCPCHDALAIIKPGIRNGKRKEKRNGTDWPHKNTCNVDDHYHYTWLQLWIHVKKIIQSQNSEAKRSSAMVEVLLESTSDLFQRTREERCLDCASSEITCVTSNVAMLPVYLVRRG